MSPMQSGIIYILYSYISDLLQLLTKSNYYNSNYFLEVAKCNDYNYNYFWVKIRMITITITLKL